MTGTVVAIGIGIGVAGGLVPGPALLTGRARGVILLGGVGGVVVRGTGVEVVVGAGVLFGAVVALHRA